MDWENARYLLVEQQIRPWNVLNPVVLDRILKTRREDFVPQDKKELAFVDVELPLANGAVMLAPKVEARFLQEIDLKATDKLLVVGAGAAYLVALAAGLCSQVVAVESDATQAELTNSQLKAAGIKNARVEVGDVLAKHASGPFDAIIATGSFATVPNELKEQLAANGRLIVVVGEEPMMHATLVTTDASERQVFDYNLPRLQREAAVFEF
ncbi:MULTISPECIES: protein-L-isoaspartate O-methyltransferase family protein [Deefgea]|uniref:Protein-L-isoaspartate O-methyltransferase n=1 Tax=Deefgea chitinilytica TaxID=570276 RepID=A0ABS2C7J4_9NEIS|nr:MULTISPECIES: protein-L-isoaspartate O-methyltransferase [Deefgea]MBM5570007.1 protein-L-isoaspartate O-methyltransferase [Deefgea chitinilytica]MBM9887236.1 protein-L-isoaspartate O-methyltransferase [Deefgea sp. CFH1-16]